MSIQNLTLLFAALVNLFMSLFVLLRGVKHNKVNLYFGLLTFFNFLWALGLLLSRMLFYFSEYWIFWSQMTYVGALGISISLFFFSLYFPLRIVKNKTYYSYIILFLGFLFSIVIMLGDYFIVGFLEDISNKVYILKFNNFYYILYSLYFVILSVFSLRNLKINNKGYSPVLSSRINYFIVTIIFGLVFGALFDLFLCYYGIFNFNWLGPLFTLPMNFVAFYLINTSNK